MWSKATGAFAYKWHDRTYFFAGLHQLLNGKQTEKRQGIKSEEQLGRSTIIQESQDSSLGQGDNNEGGEKWLDTR